MRSRSEVAAYVNYGIGALLFVLNIAYVLVAIGFVPIPLVFAALTAGLHFVDNAWARFAFAGLFYLQGFVSYVLCDIGSGPNTKFHHVAHSAADLVCLYGIVSAVCMLCRPKHQT